jgi:hypothetical protein
VATNGIEGLVVETTNWGKTAAFWQGLGYGIDFETDHHSGRLSHPAGGPYIFVVEQPEADGNAVYPLVGCPDSTDFEVPAAGELASDFEPRHWQVTEAILHDPDGRRVSVQAPLPNDVEAPAGHG